MLFIIDARIHYANRVCGFTISRQTARYANCAMKKISLLFIMLLAIVPATTAAGVRRIYIYMSPAGQDNNPGTKARPVASLEAAQKLARSRKALGKVTVWLRGGTYYLPETLVFTPQDSGTEKMPVTYAAYENEGPVLSGGTRLDLTWAPYRDGIMMANVPTGLHTDQLFVNGKRQILARYPNYDPSAVYFNGWSPEAFSHDRATRWSDPRGGIIHAMHPSLWGDVHYVITGKDADGNVIYEGGWQNNRRMGMHPQYRFVENIFEELDAPGEWFLNEKTSTLYYYPPAGLDLKNATVEAVRLRHLIELRGDEGKPVKWINFRGLTFRHAARTFMDNKEPLLRSDWTVYRGGAILLTNAEDCALEELFIDQVGGNAIFINKYNRRIAIRRTHIADAGGNGVAFVGDPKAVRSPLFEYNETQSIKDLDFLPGPKTKDYPADCILEDSLIERTGRVEKQTAPVEISMAHDITIRHNSIYDVPRAGINVSEGTWGGHVIEYNDIFDTVKETGDHGSFNAWGRDRYWNLRDIDADKVTSGPYRELPRLDAVKPIIMRNNRWRCDHGWDIDLDDGSSNYHIYNNLMLNGGIKLREGYFRVVENNVIINNSFHPHVWFKGSEDVFRHNIVFTPYRPIRIPQPWGKENDYNLLHVTGQKDVRPATTLQQQSGRDEHSLEADALFVDPGNGNYRVQKDSPALRLGFQNFPMDQFGVQWPRLKRIARTPELPRLQTAQSTQPESTRDPRPAAWMGATVKNIVGLGEVSASGLPGEIGVLLMDVPPASRAATAGLRVGDVILRLAGKSADSLAALKQITAALPATGHVHITIWRQQKEAIIEVEAPVR